MATPMQTVPKAHAHRQDLTQQPHAAAPHPGQACHKGGHLRAFNPPLIPLQVSGIYQLTWCVIHGCIIPSPNTMHALGVDLPAWWRVDLGVLKMVTSVKVAGG